jgi:hypothetical protein
MYLLTWQLGESHVEVIEDVRDRCKPLLESDGRITLAIKD